MVLVTLCPLDMTLAGHVVERCVCRLAALLRAEGLDAIELVGVAEAAIGTLVTANFTGSVDRLVSSEVTGLQLVYILSPGGGLCPPPAGSGAAAPEFFGGF